jgi:hypothetical protein
MNTNTLQPTFDRDEVGEQFVKWLAKRLTAAGTGGNDSKLQVQPEGKYWLGRLASEQTIMSSALGERAERLEPCAMGIRVIPATVERLKFKVRVSFKTWSKINSDWVKSQKISVAIDVDLPNDVNSLTTGSEEVERAIQSANLQTSHQAEIRISRERFAGGPPEISILLVNTTPIEPNVAPDDTRIYEAHLSVQGLETTPFLLEALPDSFRYDRRQFALGVNCGASVEADGIIRSEDIVISNKYRPLFWPAGYVEPDFRFESLNNDPLPILNQLADLLRQWGDVHWGSASLLERSKRELWSEVMLKEASNSAQLFEAEITRLNHGIKLLQENSNLLKAFQLMNRAFIQSSRGKYAAWRPFQLAFILSSLNSIIDEAEERETTDIVWFATGGGKTETYLGILITAAFFDRLRGKTFGITAWSRFPLRMLSLQQTQRFANSLAAAEIIRKQEGIQGAPFSLGFFVGDSSTPNAIKPDSEGTPWDPDDPEMPSKVKVLDYCPFCDNRALSMRFDRVKWRLDHVCAAPKCPWGSEPLPIFVVDEEIFRFLPTVVVGTLDKAAIIGFQAAMRGFVGAPLGLCDQGGHGFTYAIRTSKSAHGCLVPGCKGRRLPLPMLSKFFAPSFRLQDELHLLKDSLGAVDAHYEALLDSLQTELGAPKPKILASSATLTGYEKQVDVLYRRHARVFPQPGPSTSEGFWTSNSGKLMRSYLAVAPRGVTIEYAVDRTLTEMQQAIRWLVNNRTEACEDIGVPVAAADFLISTYGTNVVYGNNLKDLDAVIRSAETQIQVTGPVRTQSLTGRTSFDEVRNVLNELEAPPEAFEERIHIMAASAMMSHGVDVDRLNLMVMLGIPLTTAEFIQASARVGRRYPSLIVVMHKIGRERDASIFRSFDKFVQQGDRFVEAIPITRRSRRVLERTIAGMQFARILMVHEARLGSPLTTVGKLGDFYRNNPDFLKSDCQKIIECLASGAAEDHPLVETIKDWFARFEKNLSDPPPGVQWPHDLSPTSNPMRSLRDVEEQVKIFGSSV